jgi:mannitol/fructose-specific phosphotransferase system IIA component (Ntr-type)
MIQGFELTKDLIRFEKKAKDWKDAIRMSAQGLLDLSLVEPSYIDAMIESIEEYGPYIVIAPNIALPHARPEAGSKKIGYSFMRLEEPVYFTEEDSTAASLFIALSCVDSETHLEMLQQIVMVLSDPKKHDKLFEANTKDEIIEIFNQ